MSYKCPLFKNYKYWEEEFENVIFCDEKKFNLNGPDGLHKYWRDLCHHRNMGYNRNYGDGYLII